MKLRRIVGIVLLVAGIVALVYGGFSFSEERTALKVGTWELKVSDEERFPVPPGVAVGAIIVGIIFVAQRSK
ncbi:MAG: hypothetical protein AAGD38_13410 [Acidobacteriota bacterium]